MSPKPVARLLSSLKLLILATLISVTSIATAQDTVSTKDVVFTEITPGSADPAPVVSKPVKAAPRASIETAAKFSAVKPVVKVSLWTLFLGGLLSGFAAVLMPCIFPMLPLTVSFFTKSGKGVSKALLYGLFIILIYVSLGLAVTVIFGSDALNSLSTNGVFNFLFFILLLAFAASFLGAFELTLPARWTNKMDEKADKGGVAGMFFMAATLALISFSCTGPIVGSLLVQAATTGALLGPATGMFGFSLALAMPFTLFACFPGMLQNLPKSGGWLNSVKVTLGFLELALALKFLSNVDLAYHWAWFDREVFLVLWIVIFALLGFYLLGKLRFSHDSALNFISVPRLLLAIIVLSFTMYMVPGLWGAPLKSISAFLPPQDTQDFDLYTANLTGRAPAGPAGGMEPEPRKYTSLFHAPLRLKAFFDYKEGLAFAKKAGKPILIDFTGHACVNCRKMEAAVWPDPAVLPLIRDKFVLIQLYVDDKQELPLNEQYTSSFSHKKITTLGALNSDLQATRFNSNSQPYYVMLDADGNLLADPAGAVYSPAEYAGFLQKGLAAFANPQAP